MEELKKLEEILEPDERQKHFAVINWETGEHRPLTIEDIHQSAASIKLHDGVPEEIRSHFATAQNLLVYSWFFYPFNVTAEFLAFVTLEHALRKRFNPKKQTSFRDLVRRAVREGLVRDEGFSHIQDKAEPDSPSKEEMENLISGMQQNDKVELKEKGDVNLESFGEIKGSETALGWRSEQSVRDVIMSYMGRITYAYNKYLKLEPDLKGKVIMEITIAASGEVTACRVISSTINNSSFEHELVNIVKSFRFKSIPEGEVTVQNPFIFYRRDV